LPGCLAFHWSKKYRYPTQRLGGKRCASCYSAPKNEKTHIHMDELPKYTLAQALELGRAQTKEEPPILYAPRLDQPPPSKAALGPSIPKDVTVRQPPHPAQKPLALKPIERCPSKAEQAAFDSYWPDIEANDAVRKTLEEDMKAENLEWGFTQSPESIAQQNPLPEGVYRLDDIVKEPWCMRLYKTTDGLIKFLLQTHRYPPRFTALGLITRPGFDILIAHRLKDQSRKDQALKETKAAKRAANQAPEPVDGPSNTSATGLASKITSGK
jgi:hypothetical protein